MFTSLNKVCCPVCEEIREDDLGLHLHLMALHKIGNPAQMLRVYQGMPVLIPVQETKEINEERETAGKKKVKGVRRTAGVKKAVGAKETTEVKKHEEKKRVQSALKISEP